MTTNYYQKRKERLQQEHVKDNNFFMKKEKTKDKKGSEKDIKILPKKKEEKGVSVIKNVSKIYLSIEEFII